MGAEVSTVHSSVPAEGEITSVVPPAKAPNGASVSKILTFLRLRPSNCPGLSCYDLDGQDPHEGSTLSVQPPHESEQGKGDTMKQRRKFVFDGLLGTNATQDEVYDKVAKDVVQSALHGFNGTIFAYGQTGSGKTHTLTGELDLKSYERGIIPRALDDVFSTLRNCGNDEDAEVCAQSVS